jgi:hypothetical protein
MCKITMIISGKYRPISDTPTKKAMTSPQDRVGVRNKLDRTFQRNAEETTSKRCYERGSRIRPGDNCKSSPDSRNHCSL